MTQTPWGAPQTGSMFETGAFENAIVLMTAVNYEPSVPTTYGDKDAVSCNITVCYNPSDPSRNGEEFANARIFNVVMVQGLRNSIGSTVGGRITREPGKGGNTKLVLNPVEDENSVGYLNHYWSQHCESFKVNPADGTVLNPVGARTVSREAHAEAGAPASNPAPSSPPPPPTSAPAASQAPPPPPPAPQQAAAPATPPF